MPMIKGIFVGDSSKLTIFALWMGFRQFVDGRIGGILDSIILPLEWENQDGQVEKVKDDQAIAGYYLADEVDNIPKTPTWLGVAHTLVAVTDPYHPTIVSVWNPRKYKEYDGICDYMALDIYPFIHGILGWFGLGVLAGTLAAMRPKQRFLAIPQAFSQGNFRFPSPRETRQMMRVYKKFGAGGYIVFIWASSPTMKGLGERLDLHPIWEEINRDWSARGWWKMYPWEWLAFGLTYLYWKMSERLRGGEVNGKPE